MTNRMQKLEATVFSQLLPQQPTFSHSYSAGHFSCQQTVFWFLLSSDNPSRTIQSLCSTAVWSSA